LKKRKGSPLKPSSWKKLKATMTNMKTILTSDDFNFLIETLQDASLEIAEKKYAKERRCMNELRLNSEGYNRPYSPAA
jgi:hypothetical protein